MLPRDLQLCSETASGVDAGGQHEWGELVQLDPQTVGVIVRLERETFQVTPTPTQGPRLQETGSSGVNRDGVRVPGAEHAREGSDRPPPGSEPPEGQPLRRGAGLGAEQHPRQRHRQGDRRAALGKKPPPTPPGPSPATSCLGRTAPRHLPLPVLPQGREGEIRHLFRGFAFLHCKKLVENGGMFVCKTRHLVLAGGSKVGVSSPPIGRSPPRACC